RTDGDTPFTFKQIVSPLPNKTITISEEEESLRSLGLLPNATLVMVPIQGYTGAYTNTEQGVLGRAASVGYSAAFAGGGMIRDALGTFLGFGRATAPSASTETQASGADNGVTEQAGSRGDGVKFRTLRRPGEGEREHQLYNGNQVRVFVTIHSALVKANWSSSISNHEEMIMRISNLHGNEWMY
ncbi:MAG: hypothetical protein Q9183_007235, partial [Haloplaca sp. 2 TL-2023]